MSKRLESSLIIVVLTSIYLLLSLVAVSTNGNNSHSALAICNVLNNSTCTSNPQLPQVTVKTDKKSYGFGDYVEVSGTVGKPVQGKTVRLDVYNSKGDVLRSFNDSIPAYVPQSNRLD